MHSAATHRQTSMCWEQLDTHLCFHSFYAALDAWLALYSKDAAGAYMRNCPRHSKQDPSPDAGRGVLDASHASVDAASWSKAWLARCDALAARAMGCASPPGAPRLLGGKPPASPLPVPAAGRSALRSDACSAHPPGSAHSVIPRVLLKQGSVFCNERPLRAYTASCVLEQKCILNLVQGFWGLCPSAIGVQLHVAALRPAPSLFTLE